MLSRDRGVQIHHALPPSTGLAVQVHSQKLVAPWFSAAVVQEDTALLMSGSQSSARGHRQKCLAGVA